MKNSTCGKNYNKTNFKILRCCNNIFDLVKTESKYSHLNKPKLCKQKDFDYLLSLFS